MKPIKRMKMKHKQDAIALATEIINKHVSTGLDEEQAKKAALITIEYMLNAASSGKIEYSLYQRTYNYFAEMFSIPMELRHYAVNRPKNNIEVYDEDSYIDLY